MYFSDFFVITLYYTKFSPKLQGENARSEFRFVLAAEFV